MFYANIDHGFYFICSDMSSKRKNIPIKLSPTLPHYTNDKGPFKPEQTDLFPFGKPEVDTENNLKRPALASNGIADPQMSPPVSKKSKSPSSGSSNRQTPEKCAPVRGDEEQRDVLNTVKRVMMASSTSVSEKQKQISQMIAELQTLQHNLTAGSQVRTMYFFLSAYIAPRLSTYSYWLDN